jgi:hypothetical protein
VRGASEDSLLAAARAGQVERMPRDALEAALAAGAGLDRSALCTLIASALGDPAR